ncbi:hypothetical protein GCM10023350_09330 [Nocardioides endophyticus]|uniref:Uncharacterized protein n=1 Tax=Nocardioides endophyticus TaxID=1353775 RepID=A0ABP8YH84_9ACTN
MNKYILREPVAALQYELNSNEREIVELVRQGGRRPSFNNMRGYLHIYNDGPDLKVEQGQWVVGLGGDVGVLTMEQFNELFEPV